MFLVVENVEPYTASRHEAKKFKSAAFRPSSADVGRRVR